MKENITLPDSTFRTALVLTLPCLLVLMLYLDRPFHVDDALYVQLGEHVLEEPFAPYSGKFLVQEKWRLISNQQVEVILGRKRPSAPHLDRYIPIEIRWL